VQTLASGELGTQVVAKGTVEMVTLARAFNAMSHDLAEGERLRQKMAADIAHELRTPVSVLRGHLEAMLDGVFPMDAPHLAVANDQTLHLARLVDDLRLMTMAEAGKLPLELRTIVPAELVATAVGRFAPLAQDINVTLTRHVETDLPIIRADGDRLQQVMANLLSNALHHTPEGGRIEITASAVADTVRFSVSNSGQTLSEEMIDHVFDRFWRADTARERDVGGSGLGLAIVRQLLALHQGRIWVESAENLTTFYFDIPTLP
jgi:two-component system OmpR family sensor kinase/two-component system sensor histidine kinase BaeS